MITQYLGQPKKKQPKVNPAPTVEIFSSAVISDVHHAILDFDGKHDPIYISVSKIPTVAEEKIQLEVAKKREQEWLAAHPLLAAELELDEADKALRDAEATVYQASKTLDAKRNEPLGLTLSNPEKYPVTENWTFSYPLLDWGNYAQLDFNFFAFVDSRKKLDLLLEKGAKELFPEEVSWEEVIKKYAIGKVPSDFINSPTENILMLGEMYKGMAIEDLDYTRNSLLEQKRSIAELEKAFAVAIESRKKAENKKKTAQDKVDKENKRNQPGTATGKGKSVGDKWLHDAGKENGVPIPDRIADKLRGKKFRNFDDFRKQFWEEVSKDPELSKQFNKSNRKHIAEGRSPYAPENEQVGGREVYEIHHDKPISQGGEVYDMDNLRITTPKRHIEIHRGKK